MHRQDLVTYQGRGAPVAGRGNGRGGFNSGRDRGRGEVRAANQVRPTSLVRHVHPPVNAYQSAGSRIRTRHPSQCEFLLRPKNSKWTLLLTKPIFVGSAPVILLTRVTLPCRRSWDWRNLKESHFSVSLRLASDYFILSRPRSPAAVQHLGGRCSGRRPRLYPVRVDFGSSAAGHPLEPSPLGLCPRPSFGFRPNFPYPQGPSGIYPLPASSDGLPTVLFIDIGKHRRVDLDSKINLILADTWPFQVGDFPGRMTKPDLSKTLSGKTQKTRSVVTPLPAHIIGSDRDPDKRRMDYFKKLMSKCRRHTGRLFPTQKSCLTRQRG